MYKNLKTLLYDMAGVRGLYRITVSFIKIHQMAIRINQFKQQGIAVETIDLYDTILLNNDLEWYNGKIRM